MRTWRSRSVHVHSSGRLGNQLFLAAAAESARIRIDGRIVWHGTAEGIDAVRRLLPIQVDAIRRHGLVRRLLESDPRPMVERGVVARGSYSLWWRSQTLGRSVVIDRDGAIAEVPPSAALLIRDFHQRFENVAVARSSLATGVAYALSQAVPANLMRQVRQEMPIAVHLRFGDFMATGMGTGWGQLTPAWFVEAIRLLQADARFCRSPIWVFSDDADAALTALKDAGVADVIPIRDFGLDAVQELALLATCPAKAISNSTFSWWAGYLSDDESFVVAPSPLMRSGERESAADPRWTRLVGRWHGE